MSSGSKWAEGWDPSSQQCPFIAVRLITTAGWAADDGKEEETNKSNKIPFSSCRVSFPWRAGRHLTFMWGKAPCSGWGGDGKPSPAAGLGEVSEYFASCLPLLPSLIQCPEVSMGLHPHQCSRELWLSWGHHLCWTSCGPRRGGMAVPGLAMGSAQGNGGHRGHECGWITSFQKAQHLSGILRAVSHSL